MLEHWTPYRPELAKEYEEKGYWKKENFSQVFDNIAERFWEREALVGGDQRYTYGELKKGTDRLALHFVKMGLKHQDRVVVQLINIPEFVFIYIALQKIGVIPVMCLPQHRYTEISQIAAKAEAVGYIIPGFAKKYNYVELVEQVAADLPSMKLKMIAGVNQEVPEGYYYINELLNTPIEGEDDAELLRSYLPDPHDVCIILLSGGTTGIPKLIAREYNAYRYVAEESSRELGYNMYTVQLAVAPVAHNMVLAAPGIQGAFSFGGKVVMSTSPKTEDICKLIEKEHITHVPMVPAMIINMLNFEDRQKYDLSSWEIVINGGSKIEPVVAARVYPELGCRLISQFGMSEGTITQTSLFDSEEVTYNTIGLPVSPADEWKIVDKDDGHVTQTRKVGDFTRIEVTSVGQIYFTQSPKVSFRIEGKEKYVKNTTSEVSGGVLEIGFKDKNGNRKGNKNGVDIYITSPTLESVEFQGVGSFNCKETLKADDIRFDIEGVGSLDVRDLQCKTLTLRLQGVGEADVEVQADHVDASMNGVGSVTLSGKTRTADIDKSGIGSLNTRRLEVGED